MVLENEASSPLLLQGLDYLVNISYVDATEVFKTCLDYWNYYVPDVYTSACQVEPSALFAFTPQVPSRRRLLYAPILSKLRQLMICRMAKPEEVSEALLSAEGRTRRGGCCGEGP